MSEQEFIFAPPTVRVSFDIRPVALAFNSLMLLTMEKMSGMGEWVDATRNLLTDDRQLANTIVFDVLMMGIDPEEDFDGFPAYIRWVESLDPIAVRDRVIQGYFSKCSEYGIDPSETSPQEMLTNKQEFLRVIREAFGPKYEKKGMELDLTPYAMAHPMLNDPSAMHAYILEHLHYMWSYHLREEYERMMPMLEESIEAFNQVDFTGMTAPEAARAVTGRDLAGIWPQLETVDSLVFVPSPHIGPYVTLYPMDDDTVIIYGARVPDGVRPRSGMLSRSELLSRLNALADDTRLAILELLTREPELFAQDIMTRLGLSQSSASRHLRQLSATGFVVEKRREVAKFYSLNMDRVEDTLRALRQFLSTS